MNIIRFATPLAAYVCLSVPALADVVAPSDAGPETGLTTISMTQSVVVPLAAEDDLAARQNEALRSFYQLVGGTCATVRETVADTCEITTINFNIRRNERPNQPETIRVDGTIQMLVRLKPDVGPPAPENSRRRPWLQGNRY